MSMLWLCGVEGDGFEKLDDGIILSFLKTIL